MLTNKQDELLAMLAEECSEVIQVVNKSLRHGVNSYNPYDPDEVPNLELIKEEMVDVLAVYQMLYEMDRVWDLNYSPIEDRIQTKKRYMHYAD